MKRMARLFEMRMQIESNLWTDQMTSGIKFVFPKWSDKDTENFTKDLVRVPSWARGFLFWLNSLLQQDERFEKSPGGLITQCLIGELHKIQIENILKEQEGKEGIFNEIPDELIDRFVKQAKKQNKGKRNKHLEKMSPEETLNFIHDMPMIPIIGLLYGIPETMVKMIDKISNLEKMPPLLRKFAERWKEKC
jgi:hypothetical protein